MRFYKRRADVVFAIQYIAIVHPKNGAFPAISGASSVKIWHPEQAGRKGVRRGEEEGMSRGAESQYTVVRNVTT
jgi:hypothetical protein